MTLSHDEIQASKLNANECRLAARALILRADELADVAERARLLRDAGEWLLLARKRH